MSKEFELVNFKVKIVADADSTLSIKFDQPASSVESSVKGAALPSQIEPLVFFKKEKEGPIFWNADTRTFVKDRQRPTPNIGEWNLKRMLATSFLEKLTNVSAAKLQDQQFLAAYNDPTWDAVCKHIKL